MPGLYDHIESQLNADSSEPPKPFFDRLSKQLDDHVMGITITDLIHLKGAQKAIMLFMLRDTEAAIQGITLPDLRAKMPDIADALPKALTELTNLGWLFTSGEASDTRYRAYMRRRRSGDLGMGIWSKLASRFGEHKDK